MSGRVFGWQLDGSFGVVGSLQVSSKTLSRGISIGTMKLRAETNFLLRKQSKQAQLKVRFVFLFGKIWSWKDCFEDCQRAPASDSAQEWRPDIFSWIHGRPWDPLRSLVVHWSLRWPGGMMDWCALWGGWCVQTLPNFERINLINLEYQHQQGISNWLIGVGIASDLGMVTAFWQESQLKL